MVATSWITWLIASFEYCNEYLLLKWDECGGNLWSWGCWQVPPEVLYCLTYIYRSMGLSILSVSTRRMVNETDIVELSLNSKKFKLAVKKKEALKAMEPQVVHVAAPAAAAPAAPQPMIPAAAAPAAAPAPAPVAPKPAAAPAAVDGVEIASPMAGTFYRSPAPGEPAFVNEGDRVTQGQTIGIIEAMKLMNEIEAEVSGTVVKITADNGKPVTPGQTLIVIKP